VTNNFEEGQQAMIKTCVKTSFLAVVVTAYSAAQPAKAPPEPPPPPAAPVIVDVDEINDAVQRAKEAVESMEAIKLPPMPPLPAMPAVNEAVIRAKAAVAMSAVPAVPIKIPPIPPLADFDFDHEFQAKIDKLNDQLVFAYAQPPQPPQPPVPAPAPAGKWGRYNPERNSEENLYRSGTRHLDRREYDAAVEAFDAAAAKKGPKADGAYYWKAYSLAKLGRRDESIAVLNELQKSYPSSRWLDDAKALAVEVRQAGGQAVSPESQSDEEVKLMAINAIMQSDPDRALPLLEKLLSRGGSPKLKERALFVLAQSRSPQARDVVIQFAKGKGNPDLQYKAVEYLGMQAGGNTLQVLGEIYGSTNDPNLKRRLLHSFMASGDKERLFSAAKSESDVALRREAIQLLGATKAIPELTQLYGAETNVEVKEAIMQGLFVGGAHDRLIELAKSETDPKLRRRAINQLGAMGRSPQAADALVAMYGTEPDQRLKRDILNALFHQQNVTRIIEIARKETDPELKRDAVQRLSNMKSKEATDFLIELLNK
jgi:HEAT repeat protein